MWRTGAFRDGLLALLALIALQGPAKAECRFGDQLTLLHFNDLHGQLAPISGAVDGQAGGIARIARRVADVRAEDPDRPVLLLFAGDLLQGTLTSSLFMGQPDVLLLERMGLDAAALGNHEFDDGQDNFRRLAELASFPFLSANVQARPRPLPVQSHLMLGGDAEPAIAVLGLTTAELLTTTHPRNTQGLRAESPVAVASALVPRLRAHADLVVVLSHLGLAADRRLAREVAGIDVIVGGHDHKALRAPVVESGVSILQAGARGQWLGRMDLGCVQGRLQPSRYQLIPVVASLPEDPEIAAEVDCIVAQAEAGMGEVIGRVDVDLSAAREGIRRGEAIFGDFVADLARDITAADVALFNGGGFRASIPRGEVTLKQVYEALPFGNQLVVGELAGAQIVAALERSAGLDPAEEPGGFLQVSGLRYAIADGRLLSARFDAAGRGTQAIDPSRRYRVVMPDYLAAGGDGYAMLAQHGEQVMTGRLVAEVVIAAIRSGAQPPSGLDGRILRH